MRIILVVLTTLILVGCSDVNRGQVNNNQAELNPSEEWTYLDYVNEFGEKTDERLITNPEPIMGKFNNVATSQSNLFVTFVISGEDKIEIMLSEYQAGNVVKTSIPKVYVVKMKFGNTDYVHEFIAAMVRDRIFIPEDKSKIVLNMLKSKRTHSVYIYEEERPINEYMFNFNGSSVLESMIDNL